MYQLVVENFLNSLMAMLVSTSLCGIVFLSYAFYRKYVVFDPYTITIYPVTMILFFLYVVSVVIGFSLFPAYRASQINLIETLRDE